MDLSNVGTWTADWTWSLPLIVLTVVIHVIGLGAIAQIVVEFLRPSVGRRHFLLMFMVVMGVTALLATALHAFEAAIWAAAYLYLEALPDTKSAILFSLNAMTTYGHVDTHLPDHWRMMGALEALNGVLLFGLTTAFLFAIIQKVWPLGDGRRTPTN